MTTVTVDLADLETIIFATGAIKNIEAALANRRNDPFVRPHLDYTEAHDRLATAMRQASRAEAGTAVNFDAPLTKTEARLLRDMVNSIESADLPWFRISGPDKAGHNNRGGEYESLAAKGCIRMGQAVTGVVFSGDRPSLVHDAERGYLVEVTARGRAKLTAYEGTPLGAG